MSPAQILATGATKRFGDLRAVDGVDLHLAGGITTLLGPNGSGKTTLLRCLATVSTVDEGELLVDGLDPRHETDRLEVRRRLGYLPQEPGFARSATVFDVVEYVAILRGSRDERARRLQVLDVVERVGLGERLSSRVADLSGGMRRRLGLAQSILGSPTLLLLDEPAAGLDPDERLRLREIVTEQRDAATVLVSTHHTAEAVIGDRVAVLDGGRLVFVGPPEQLAAVASGRTWVQASEPKDVRASWRQADGKHRCLGAPPPDAALVNPTLEDGYLLLVGA